MCCARPHGKEDDEQGRIIICTTQAAALFNIMKGRLSNWKVWVTMTILY